MAHIEVTPVIIHDVVTPERIEIRTRTSAGDYAIREESIFTTDADLKAAAQTRGEKTWDETDIAAIASKDKLPAVWGADEAVTALRGDIL